MVDQPGAGRLVQFPELIIDECGQFVQTVLGQLPHSAIKPVQQHIPQEPELQLLPELRPQERRPGLKFPVRIRRTLNQIPVHGLQHISPHGRNDGAAQNSRARRCEDLLCAPDRINQEYSVPQVGIRLEGQPVLQKECPAEPLSVCGQGFQLAEREAPGIQAGNDLRQKAVRPVPPCCDAVHPGHVADHQVAVVDRDDLMHVKKTVLRQDIIGIQEGDEFALRCPKSRIAGGPGSGVLLIDSPEPVVRLYEGVDQFGGSVRRSVVHTENLEIAVALAFQ